jgi:hypothetical protein
LAGLDRLLDVPRNTFWAGGVAIALYGLSLHPSVLETVCRVCSLRLCLYLALSSNPAQTCTAQLPHLMAYVLFLLAEGGQWGSRHAALCLTRVFAFRPLLALFDEMDGMRPLLGASALASLSISHILISMWWWWSWWQRHCGVL